MPTALKSYSQIKPGSFYEDCGFHPCVCTRVNPEDDEIQGISLVDGSYPRSCSVKHCGVQLLSFDEAVNRKLKGPPRGRVPKHKQWWSKK